MSIIAKLHIRDNSTPIGSITYQKTIGTLQYLGLTHPDIAFIVIRLSQFMQQPTIIHWAASKRLLRYLKHTMLHAILLQKHDQFHLKTYNNADWESNSNTRVSTTTFITFLDPNLISLSAHKQRVVSRSSTEAEFCVLTTATSETIYVNPRL
jgi:hypothetical protein